MNTTKHNLIHVYEIENAPCGFSSNDTNIQQACRVSDVFWRALNHGAVTEVLPGCPADGVPKTLIPHLQQLLARDDLDLSDLLYVHCGVALQDRNPMLGFLGKALLEAGVENLRTMALRVPIGTPRPSPEVFQIAAALSGPNKQCVIVHDRISRMGRADQINDAGYTIFVSSLTPCLGLRRSNPNPVSAKHPPGFPQNSIASDTQFIERTENV